MKRIEPAYYPKTFYLKTWIENDENKRQTDKQTSRQTDKQTNRQADKQTNRQADKQTNIQTDKQTDRQTDKQTDKQTYIRTFLRIAEKGNFSFQTSRPPSTVVCRRRSEPGPGAVRLLVVVLPLPQLSLDHDFGRHEVVAGRRRRHRASSERVAFALGNVVRKHRRWNRRTVIIFLGKWKPETKRKSLRTKNTT